MVNSESEENRIKMVALVKSLSRDELEKLAIEILEREKSVYSMLKNYVKLTPRQEMLKKAKSVVDEMFGQV